MIVAGFVAAAALGGVIRWVTTIRLPPPLGTLTVNLAGSFLLGLLAGAGPTARTVAGVAFLGSCTTFSTLAAELHDLADRHRRGAATYGAATVIGGVGLAWLGLRLS
jgi:CrcB protein